MASTTDEAKIRIGVDGTQINPTLLGISRQINKFSNDAIKKLSSIFKANVFGAATDLALQIVPSWQEIWDKVLGTDPLTMQKRDESMKNLRGTIEALKAAKKELAEAQKGAAYDNAKPLEKAAMLRADLMKSKADEEKTRKEFEEQSALAEYRRQNPGLAGLTQEAIEETLSRRNRAETKLNEILKERVATEQKLRGLVEDEKNRVKNLSPEEVAAEFQNTLGKNNKQVYKSRLVLRSIDSALANDPNNKEALAARLAEVGNIQSLTRERTLGKFGNISKTLGIVDGILPGMGFDEVSKSLATAQIEAMKAVIQRVSIVEIKE